MPLGFRQLRGISPILSGRTGHFLGLSQDTESTTFVIYSLSRHSNIHVPHPPFQMTPHIHLAGSRERHAPPYSMSQSPTTAYPEPNLHLQPPPTSCHDANRTNVTQTHSAPNLKNPVAKPRYHDHHQKEPQEPGGAETP